MLHRHADAGPCRFLAVNGLTIHPVEMGSGPTVALLHGSQAWAYTWWHQIEPLADAGYQAITPDLPGSGYSDLTGPEVSTCLGQDRGHDARWLRHFYACLAPVYDRALLKSPGYRQVVHDLITRLGIGAEDTALDVGCGTGLLTLPLAERTQQTIGLDLSLPMLEKLACKVTRPGLSVELCERNVLNLPFADREFTLVTAAFMLHHLTLAEKQRALAEIHRVLVSGGRLGCLNSLGEIADVFLTRERWQTLLAEAGFTDVQIEDRYDVFRLVTARRGEIP